MGFDVAGGSVASLVAFLFHGVQEQILIEEKYQAFLAF